MYSLSKYSLSKYFILASLCLLLGSGALAQSTTVSGQVTDSGGQAWNNGTFMFQFIPNNNYPSANYSWTGGVFSQIITGSLNSTGGYSLSIPSNTSITPSLSQWRLQVCSATNPVNCFSVTQTITGGSQTVNVTPPPVVVPPGAGNTAYVTSEVSPAIVGSQIYIIGTGFQVCSTVAGGVCTVWTGTSSASSSPVNSHFFISNVNCSLATNCLQMVDDDSTDNCGAALTAWLAVVNAYAGPGKPQVTIYGSGPGKSYKLTTANCELAFTSTKGANVHNWATINCAQSGQDCIRFGANGNVVSIVGQDYSLDGTGVLYGGASLTTGCSQACAGVLIKAGTNNFYINGTQFQGALGGTTGGGFGANSVTPGLCTNYLIYVENPVATGIVQHTKGGVTSSTSTSGGCGYANPNGALAGTNTVKFVDNIIGTLGFSGGSGACGSVGIIDGGSYGTTGDNVIYGFGMPIRVQGQGHIIRHNELDNAQCAAAGLTAAINVGANGSSAAIPGLNVDGNIVQGGSNHSIDLLAIAGDSTATIAGASLTNNQTAGASTANLTHTNTSCTPNVSQGNQCWISGNINMNNTLSSGNAGGIGWSNGLAMAGFNSTSNLGANLATTVLVRVPTTRTYIAWCEVEITTRDAVSSTLPSCQFSYTDAVSGAVLTRTVSPTNTGNLVGTISDGFITVIVTGGTDIQYSTTGYLSNTASQMKYFVGGFIATY